MNLFWSPKPRALPCIHLSPIPTCSGLPDLGRPPVQVRLPFLAPRLDVLVYPILCAHGGLLPLRLDCLRRGPKGVHHVRFFAVCHRGVAPRGAGLRLLLCVEMFGCVSAGSKRVHHVRVLAVCDRGIAPLGAGLRLLLRLEHFQDMFTMFSALGGV